MQTDEQLALDVQQGRTGSLNMLVERHYPMLMGYLYRMMGGQRTLAEDLAQETFLHVLRGIRQYQYPRPFKAWLYAIATNLARNHYKRADTRYTDNADDEFDAADDVLPEDLALASDEARTVALALAKLPEHQREVVVLYYYQELALAEIAAALEIPLGTVKSRLSIGLRRLRTMMETSHE